MHHVCHGCRIFSTGCELPRNRVLPIKVESNTVKHLRESSKFLDMSQSEALPSVNLMDPEVVVNGLARQARLLFRDPKNFGRDVFGLKTIQPRRFPKFSLFINTEGHCCGHRKKISVSVSTWRLHSRPSLGRISPLEP